MDTTVPEVTTLGKTATEAVVVAALDVHTSRKVAKTETMYD